MRKLTIGIFLILNTIAFGQENLQETLSKFIISDATKNGNDMTEIYLDSGGFIVFYTQSDSELYMANVLSNENSQSFGRLYNTEIKKLKESYDNFEADIFYFKWRYINSYNTNRGTATVELIKIYKPQGVTFILTIIPENLDVLIYKGYMEGTLDLNKYSK